MFIVGETTDVETRKVGKPYHQIMNLYSHLCRVDFIFIIVFYYMVNGIYL